MKFQNITTFFVNLPSVRSGDKIQSIVVVSKSIVCGGVNNGERFLTMCGVFVFRVSGGLETWLFLWLVWYGNELI